MKRRKPKGPPRPVYLYAARTVHDGWRVGRNSANVYDEAFSSGVHIGVFNPCHSRARQVFRDVRRGQIKRFAVVPA